MKKNTLLYIARSVSISLPTSLFSWILMILINPIFTHVYVLLSLQPFVYLIVELALYLHRLLSKWIEKQRNAMPPAPKPAPEPEPEPAPEPEPIVTKKEGNNPPINGQAKRERERTYEEEFLLFLVSYY